MAKTKTIPQSAMVKPDVAPTTVIIRFSDGSEQIRSFGGGKPSTVRGKGNFNASNTLLGPDGSRYQLGCNVTRLE